MASEPGTTTDTSSARLDLVVVGNGMVGHKLLQALADAGALEHVAVTVLGEEIRPAYDRVGLTSWFERRDADDLALTSREWFTDQGIDLHLGDPVAEIDRDAKVVRTVGGAEFSYDRLVLATGSAPFVPPIPGAEGPDRFVYRTIEDLEAIAAAADRPEVTRGVVVGGGLLGLEAANALRKLGLDTHVLEMAPGLMPVQLDARGGEVLRSHIEALGVTVHTGVSTRSVDGDEGVSQISFAEGDPLPTDIVVFSAGIRPRDQLARDCGIEVGERGGIVVDGTLSTSDPAISAIGECALFEGRIYGLVAPGYTMARVLAAHLGAQALGAPAPDDAFTPADMSTKLKLLGVDVASLGDPHADRTDPDTRALVWDDPVAGTYEKLVVSADGSRALGAVLVGDASAYSTLLQVITGTSPVPDEPALLLARGPQQGNGGGASGLAALPAEAVICSCENVTKGSIEDAVASGCSDLDALKCSTKAGTGCGGCVPQVTALMNDALRRAGVEVSTDLCPHFAHTRADLFDLVRINGMTSFAEVLEAYGSGAGCDICKPTVGSILATVVNEHILDGDRAAIQDTNDRFLANMQKDGTYSVVPRVPGGEITPEKLIVIGEVARDFDLYTKITGGQRIDLFGATVDQLPVIWKRLVDAGFESGHAYGKSLRTVKSCVGETWCRYGVQDSTAMAILLEDRYKGLRSPHKIKMAVSGCARECAEAQSKDVGVIATERGWNLYVGGNGGKQPRHADLLAEDLSDDELVRAIDRYLMYYVRTADRLQRTSTWVEGLEGGLDRLRAVIFDDVLGVAAELDAAIAHHLDTYECEWAATLERPERLARFTTFVNAPRVADPTISFVKERGQIRPGTKVLAGAVPSDGAAGVDGVPVIVRSKSQELDLVKVEA
ncbi:MAG: nitrite reductase large subunit [Acidimicrobiales bacterium]|nr:nitrite reductase large subunit [Acidimicrobiales bacterium]